MELMDDILSMYGLYFYDFARAAAVAVLLFTRDVQLFWSKYLGSYWRAVVVIVQKVPTRGTKTYILDISSSSIDQRA